MCIHNNNSMNWDTLMKMNWNTVMKKFNSITTGFYIAIAVIAMTATSVQAAFISYSDLATWQTAAGPISGSENFNGFVADVSLSATPTPLNDGISIGSTTGNGSIDVLPIVNTNETDVDGTPVAAFFNTNGIFMTFSSPINALGFDLKSLNDNNFRTAIEIYFGASLLDTLTPPIALGQLVQFFGFVGNAGETFTEIRFVQQGTLGDRFGLDNIKIADNAIPEPATLAIFGLGLAGLGFMRRRRAA